MSCTTDIIFVLHDGGSVGTADFGLLKSFLSQLVDTLDIERSNTRVGLVTFSSKVGNTIDLNDHLSVAGLQSAISTLNYSGGSTNTAAALDYVRTVMLTSAAGDRSDVPNVVVVLTDGPSDNIADTQVRMNVFYLAILKSEENSDKKRNLT